MATAKSSNLSSDDASHFLCSQNTQENASYALEHEKMLPFEQHKNWPITVRPIQSIHACNFNFITDLSIGPCDV